jgi:two-component system, cell cycle sensor histidine kinase and response regulator CckA
MSKKPTYEELEQRIRELEKAEFEHQREEKTLREQLLQQITLMDVSLDGIAIIDQNHRVRQANRRFAQMLGYSMAEVLHLHTWDWEAIMTEEEIRTTFEDPTQTQATFETRHRRKDGTVYDAEITACGAKLGEEAMVLTITRDITERKIAEEEKRRLEAQYQQSQKVEAIGRLAGGVAHDMNNLLVPILGYADLMLNDLGQHDARREQIEQILLAGRRAQNLVRQLLAFGRKQTLRMESVYLHRIVADFNKLLRRTIPENITIHTSASAPDEPAVRADSGQVEQVLLNLVVNAADAMPDGGRITIETALVKLDATYASDHLNAVPGTYVMLSISDTGHGMDEYTCAHVFEPFFSTKGEKGTGLGLATVYGIVKQHGGYIWVYSEPDLGTTFKVYLPALSDVEPQMESTRRETLDVTGTETIIIVEDNEQVLQLSCNVLKRLGYTILPAGDAEAALKILRNHDGRVHLMLTDVILPGRNGRELYQQAQKGDSRLKVLYMSGYTDEVIVHHNILDEGVPFIQKPFSIQALAAKVREVLDDEGIQTQ